MACGSSTDTRKLVRFVNNVPTITQGSDTLLSFNPGNLTPFFQEVSEYYVDSISLGTAGATSLIQKDLNFILIKVSWPSTALESEKKLELQLSNFDIVGGTGSTALGATSLSLEKIPIKDIFMINAVETHKHLQITNNSKHKVTLNLLTAKT